MPYIDIIEMCNELNEYVELDNSEIAEVCSLLIDLAHYTGYVSQEFENILEMEIKKQLKNYKENSTIVEKPVERYVTKVKELHWNN